MITSCLFDFIKKKKTLKTFFKPNQKFLFTCLHHTIFKKSFLDRKKYSYHILGLPYSDVIPNYFAICSQNIV